MIEEMLLFTLVTGAAGLSTPGVWQQRVHRGVARLRRIEELQQLPATLTASESRELEGLLTQGDPYNATEHSEQHRQFKAAHNRVFATLAANAGGGSAGGPAYYLDGADGATTAALRAGGFDTEQLFTTNLFDHTCTTLRELHGLQHVRLGSAEHQLSCAPLCTTPFVAYYLDGCSGQASPLVEMVRAIFHERRIDANPARLVLGFTLTRAEPTGRSLGDRELDVLRAIAAGCRAQGYGPPSHPLEEPAVWGLDADIGKEAGGTLTTWVVCERGS